MQIILCEVNKSILTVGFKENNFVVYSSIYHDITKTKQQLLQQAYEQVKETIDYEKTLDNHSFVTDKIGEEFIPEVPKAKITTLSLSNNHIQFEENQEEVTIELSSATRDQYDEIMVAEVAYTSTEGAINNNILTIPKITEYAEVIVTVNVGDINDSKTIYLYPYIEQMPSMEEIKIRELEHQLLEVQQYIIDSEYEKLLSEGGM